jgi:hypothetical protein
MTNDEIAKLAFDRLPSHLRTMAFVHDLHSAARRSKTTAAWVRLSRLSTLLWISISARGKRLWGG